MSGARKRSMPLPPAASGEPATGPMAHPNPEGVRAGRPMARRVRAVVVAEESANILEATDAGEGNRGVAAAAESVTADETAAKLPPSDTAGRKTAAIGSLARRLPGLFRIFGRRAIPREPRRREFAAVLGLVLVACAISAGLPGAWAARSQPSASPTFVTVANAVVSATPEATDSADPLVDPATAPPTFQPDFSAALATPWQPPTDQPTAAPVKTPVPIRVYTFVALGDSLTSGYGDPGPAWPTRLDAQDARLTMLHNAGVPGDDTSDMLARLNADVLAYKPDVMFLLGGTNDLGHDINPATTIANLRAIIVAARAHNIRVILMTVPPDSYPSMVARIDSLNAQIVHLGNTYGLVIVDVHAALSTADGVYVARYTVDGLHFSAAGAQVVANTVYTRVRRAGL